MSRETETLQKKYDALKKKYDALKQVHLRTQWVLETYFDGDLSFKDWNDLIENMEKLQKDQLEEYEVKTNSLQIFVDIFPTPIEMEWMEEGGANEDQGEKEDPKGYFYMSWSLQDEKVRIDMKIGASKSHVLQMRKVLKFKNKQRKHIEKRNITIDESISLLKKWMKIK